MRLVLTQTSTGFRIDEVDDWGYKRHIVTTAGQWDQVVLTVQDGRSEWMSTLSQSGGRLEIRQPWNFGESSDVVSVAPVPLD